MDEYARVTEITKTIVGRNPEADNMINVYLRLSHESKSTVYKLNDGWAFAGLIGGVYFFLYSGMQGLSSFLSQDFALN